MLNMLRTKLFPENQVVPEAVHGVIAEHQNRAEILISWIQLGIVITFAVLYTLGRKAFPDNIAFEPVPYVLGIYGIFTLLRLYLAYRHVLAGWIVSLSIVLDMAVLMGLIFSFHIQYMQPPTFYLKAPTLLYVFIFISLRALRLETRFILQAGVAAILGWSAMVGYVFFNDNPMITRNYIDYMTSNVLLLGAEFDKLISIAVVTLVLAMAVSRGRQLLVQAVKEGRAATVLSRFFDPAVAHLIRNDDSDVAPGQGVVRHAAILYVDLRGFTALAKRIPPQDIVHLLTTYHAVAVPIITQHGGTVDKFLGDGIMCTFGAVRESPTFAADALRAVVDIRAALYAWANDQAVLTETPLLFGAGVATGEIVFGAVGDGQRLEYTVIGDASNLAAKMEKHTKAAKVFAAMPKTVLDMAIMQGLQDHLVQDFAVRPEDYVAGVPEPVARAVLAHPHCDHCPH